MSLMTLNNVKTLFSNIATSHQQLNDFGFGELWEIEQKMNKDITYPILFVSPVSSLTLSQTKQRTFQLLVFDLVKTSDVDNSQCAEVWSDTEQIMDDIIKILKNESNDYNLIGDPQSFPFKEDFSDWAAGYRCEITLETEFASNYCDVPSDTFTSPNTSEASVTIVDQDGNVLATINGGGSYTVTVLSGINDTLTANVTTIVDNII